MWGGSATILFAYHEDFTRHFLTSGPDEALPRLSKLHEYGYNYSPWYGDECHRNNGD